MQALIAEDTVTRTRSCNPMGAALNADARSEQAFLKHHKKFNSTNHIDRTAAICIILEKFFGHPANHFTYRGLGRQAKRPFENIKMTQVGHILSRTPNVIKNQNLYQPLQALGNVEVISKNGHLIVRNY